MSDNGFVRERFGLRRRVIDGLRAIISIAMSTSFVVWVTNSYATTNELDNDYFSFVVGQIISRGFPCSSGDIGHILYEDDLVAVLEVTCESGESCEIIDIYNLENVIIEPIEKMTDEEMDNYFNRISYSIT